MINIMTNNNFWEDDEELMIEHNYQKILQIDNDSYIFEGDIEVERRKIIANIISILDEYPNLLLSKAGTTFLDTIIYPPLRA
jgi:hypothetical protein